MEQNKFYIIIEYFLGYEKDVVDSVRKQLEIFTTALQQNTSNKFAKGSENETFNESETNLTEALEAQLRSFYTKLL